MRLYRALTASVLLYVTVARADDLPLSAPETVVTATRIPSSPANIPAGVTVIDRATIVERGYNSLTQALSDVPGLHVSQAGELGGQTSVFIRGSNSDHVLVLRDGMPINDGSDPTSAFNFGIDTLADIQRIEIIRGPMAALYGSGAIGGVINLISLRGTEPGIHWSGDLAGGYPALIRGSITASGVEGPVDFALTAESQSQRGYDPIPQRESVHTGVPQGFRDRVLTMNLGYTPVDGTRLSLFLRAQTAYFGFDTFGGFDAEGNPLPTSMIRIPTARSLLCWAVSVERPSCSTAGWKAASSSGGCRMTVATRSRSCRRIQTRRRPTRAIMAIGPTCSGTTRCIWTIC